MRCWGGNIHEERLSCLRGIVDELHCLSFNDVSEVISGVVTAMFLLDAIVRHRVVVEPAGKQHEVV